MNVQDLPADLETPAFVYDETAIQRLLGYGDLARSRSGCRVLYSVKALALPDLLEFMAPRLDGFAASSPFEARLARGVLGQAGTGGSLHLTTPGIRPADVAELGKLCDYLAFNSLTQWRRYRAVLEPQVSCGLRVNPRLSFLEDERYDPCRPDSKLGVPLEAVAALWEREPDSFAGIEGLLVHTNCESPDLREVEATVHRLCRHLDGLLRRLRWINLGGGYLLAEAGDLEPLYRAVSLLRTTYGLEVFIEPGAAFVRSAGYIITTVLDLFTNGGQEIAILDTTVNHLPEVLEFDFEPDVLGHDDRGEWEYILAGCTCLAGDLFGTYRFHAPLQVGDRLVFPNAGAYTLPKAHTFNGVNLPTIYARREGGGLELKQRYTYADYAARWGAYAGSIV